MEDSTPQPHGEQGVMPEFDIGDYITGNTDVDGNHVDIFSEFQQQTSTSAPMSMETTAPPQNVLRSNNTMPQGPQTMTMAAILKGRLEQQIKLQELQQLQNQILQQQIELISNQSSMNNQQKDVFNGLLTPAPSTELRALASRDLVSPILLQHEMYINSGTSATTINQLSPHQHDLSMSAPAALAFQISSPFPLPSPAEAEYDLSPLTSPWLLPAPAQQHRQYPDQNVPEQFPPRSMHLKRAVSIGEDEEGGKRKRLVSAEHFSGRRNGPHIPSPSSSTSTSPMTTVGQAPGSGKLVPQGQDTPSPVDLSMPPPAPPTSNSHPTISSASSSTSLSAPGSASVSPSIAPVTPASIMNLRPLATGLVPSHLGVTSLPDSSAHELQRRPGKSKNTPRLKVADANGPATRSRRGSIVKPGVSPNLKPILPGAVSTATSPLVQPCNPSGFGSTSANTLPGPRKTSHKAAEQKRRDSLKTSFDDLRTLLPPVPLPDDAGDEPPLPGSMPPRGPPKGDADGPNRGVSKLALLRCGNTYIRELKGKVARRDAEIERLRTEVRRLHAVTGDTGGLNVDLERDVDEGELSAGLVGQAGRYGEVGEEDEG